MLRYPNSFLIQGAWMLFLSLLHYGVVFIIQKANISGDKMISFIFFFEKNITNFYLKTNLVILRSYYFFVSLV